MASDLPRLDELEAKDAAATPGPWNWHWRPGDEITPGSVYSEAKAGQAVAVAMCPKYGRKQFPADADLIVASRSAIRLSRALADALWACATADRYADEVPALGDAVRLLEAVGYAPRGEAVSECAFPVPAPTFKWSDLDGLRVRVQVNRDGETVVVILHDEKSGISYVVYIGKEEGNA